MNVLNKVRMNENYVNKVMSNLWVLRSLVYTLYINDKIPILPLLASSPEVVKCNGIYRNPTKDVINYSV